MLTTPKALLALVFCLALLCNSSAQSQRRSGQQQVGAQNAPTTQPPEPDQRGTDQVPLMVKVLPAPDTKEKAEQEERDRTERAKLDAEKTIIDTKLAFETQRIADYTDRLTWFTIGLFCTAVLQAALFIWQLWLIRDSLVEAKKASKLAETGAHTAQQQIELARAEFLSTHRPRMRLKHAWFTDQIAWRLAGPLEINLDFVNIGSGTAYVHWINYQSILLPKGERLPQRPPYDEIPPNGLRITRFGSDAIVNVVNSGVTLPRSVCDGILDDVEVHDILWGKRTLYLIGTIEYWDTVHKHLRQTAFCRSLTYQQYPPASGDMGRFSGIKDPDYEYED